jgi:hypothetical protein
VEGTALLVSDWPARTDKWGKERFVISSIHPFSLGDGLRQCSNFATPTSQAWPAANRAILIPFRLPMPVTVFRMITGCGAVGGGNFDTGIYDMFGNLRVSSGSTAQVAATKVAVNVTDTLLGEGVYYMALSVDGTANMSANATNLQLLKLLGVRQASSAFTLTSTITFETAASAYVPMLGIEVKGF